MKDLRPYNEIQELINSTVHKPEEHKSVRFLATKEFLFNLKKNILKHVVIYSTILCLLLLIKYPAPIGYAVGKWVKDFTNAFTEQIYQIKKRPSA